LSVLRKHSDEETADRLAVPPNVWWLIPMGIASILLGAITIRLLLMFTLESFAVGSLLMFLLVLPTAVSVFFRPISLALDPEQRVINSSTLLGAKRSIRVDDLVGFSAGEPTLAYMNYKSRILYHADGRHTDLSEFTLKSIDNLEAFLQRSGVPFLGMESSFFPFGKFKYRFDPK
jgi:hypothetical protein